MLGVTPLLGPAPPSALNTLPGRLPARPALPFTGPPAYLQSERSDNLRADELQVQNLRQKLDPDSPEARQLQLRLRDAQRQLDLYRLSPSPDDARMRRQRLDDSLHALDMARLRAEGAAAARPHRPSDEQ